MRMALTDIGTGKYTVFTQVAARMMGLAEDRVRMLLGDSDFPPTPGSGGSFGAGSAGSGLCDACTNLRAALARRLGAAPDAAVFAQGRVSGAGSETLGELAGSLGLEASGEIQPGVIAKQFSQQSYGGHFAEVAVNADTGEVRLWRMLGVVAAGRILNMKTAISRGTGAMIWGVGAALH